jgi:hypothetical protein
VIISTGQEDGRAISLPRLLSPQNCAGFPMRKMTQNPRAMTLLSRRWPGKARRLSDPERLDRFHFSFVVAKFCSVNRFPWSEQVKSRRGGAMGLGSAALAQGIWG